MGDFYWEDEGAIYADMDYEANLQREMSDEEYEEYVREERLKQMRTNRLLKQRGKYLISACKNGKTIYLQDQRISKGGYWTQFKANARVFKDREQAEQIASGFKYNNPKVICG